MTNVETEWQHAPHDFELPADEVHVWRARLDRPQNCIDGLLQVLSTQEREHADRFHFDADRKRAIIGRGLARLLLGHCLDRPADELRIEYNEFGKPALSAVHHSPLQFNVSHAGDLILVALAGVTDWGWMSSRCVRALPSMLSRHDSFHRTNAVPWLRLRRSHDARLFFPAGTSQRGIS